MKRGRGKDGSLTGGTGDVSPQFFNMSQTQSAADTTTSGTFPVPIQRLPAGGKAQVMELLRIYWTRSAMPVSASTTEASDVIGFSLTTSNFGTTTPTNGLAEPRVIYSRLDSNRSAFTAGGTYMFQDVNQNGSVDVTDGAGHGVLIATDNIFLQVQSTTTGAANNVNMKLLYRWKNVRIEEYIGIVQSQQ